MFLRWFDVPGRRAMAAWKPWGASPFFFLAMAGEEMLGMIPKERLGLESLS